ncbi:MAG: hypothetical protein Q4C58_10685 [Eubacteriales bacterium]|nr:hypothetical protein [Eubacteriales bacterium]
MNANELSNALVHGFRELWKGLQTNTYPAAFFTDALGMSTDATKALPGHVAFLLAVCMICGAITLLLRWKAGQRSISGWGDQLVNVLLSLLTILCIPVLLLLYQYVAEANTAALKLYPDKGIAYWKEFLETAYPVLMVAIICVAMMLWPLFRFKDYLVCYHLKGLFHGIFEVGTGFFIAGVAIQAMYRESPAIYLLIPVYLLMLFLRQRGGWNSEFKKSKKQ